MKIFIRLTIAVFLISQLTTCKITSVAQKNTITPNKWESLKTVDEGGLLGERVDLWRNNRLWFIGESDYIIDGFENRPGTHPWQGEHVGKWLHAATLAYAINGDEKLKAKLDEIVERLIATQLPSGYLGTYGQNITFMAVPENGMKAELADDIQPTTIKVNSQGSDKATGGGWDTWTIRYNLYGLLTYESYFPNEKVVEACKRMGDLLIEYYGDGKYDLTKYGTRQGISATTLLESIVLLYERTLDPKYLAFAERIVEVSEGNPKLRLMGTMLEKGSVVYSGDGKGYQLMANLLGYLRLYRSTQNEQYLEAVVHGWNEINQKHVLVTGGPWTRKMSYNANKECFAHTEAFDPEKIVVEGCCDATWMQLNFHLFELTGDAKYMNAAEVTMLNSVYGHQHTDGVEWCYYTSPNENQPLYENRFHCCASSEPRGLEMYSHHLAGKLNENLSLNTLFPSVVELSEGFGGGKVSIKGSFPAVPSAEIHIETLKEKKFTLEFRIPGNTLLSSVKLNGKKIETKQNGRGFYELNHTWKKGDVISIEMAYELTATIQEGEEDGKWIAFTYGPFALGQKISEIPGDEPFSNLAYNDTSKFLAMLSKSPNKDIEFSITGTDIILIPYYLTGTKQSGPRTYFKL